MIRFHAKTSDKPNPHHQCHPLATVTMNRFSLLAMISFLVVITIVIGLSFYRSPPSSAHIDHANSAALPCNPITVTLLDDPAVRINRQRNFGAVLHDAATLFEKHGVRFWIDFGTLIGWARECSILDKDHDIDVGVWASEYLHKRELQEELKKLMKEKYHMHLRVQGHKYGRAHQHIFIMEGEHRKTLNMAEWPDMFDIFIYDDLGPDKDKFLQCHNTCRKNVGEVYREWPGPKWGFEAAYLAGARIHIPQNWENMLVTVFGPGWVRSDKKTKKE